MAGMSVADVRRMMIAVAHEVIANEEYLCHADREIGDGDHGMGMARGFKAVAGNLGEESFTGVYQIFFAIGRTLIKTMGGASGIIFGLLFYAGAKDQPDKEELDASDLAGLLRRSLREIMAKGGARAGDKTMLDALEPMVEALEESAAEAESLPVALRKAADAAEAGKERSRAYIARFGKAKTLGERAIGFPDAGAVSLALIAKVMADWAAQNLRD